MDPGLSGVTLIKCFFDGKLYPPRQYEFTIFYQGPLFAQFWITRNLKDMNSFLSKGKKLRDMAKDSQIVSFLRKSLHNHHPSKSNPPLNRLSFLGNNYMAIILVNQILWKQGSLMHYHLNSSLVTFLISLRDNHSTMNS